ncbi:penicillin-binding protein 1A [Sporocytophaga myxococcoides]|uniref:penicillin-binding protein 1A n=1 Tax=Sporocytophaga myxococcoides TaxID=153721 RepID=UPI000426B92B|nr:transglycosylase domain-containing protein [Sporocytophaga myxococcoides]
MENNRKFNFQQIAKYVWIIAGGMLYYIIGFVILLQINFLWLFGQMPGVEDLENPSSDQASEIYSADNILLGKYFRENRSPVDLTQISPNVINALISTEDVRFYEHSGIDAKGFFAIFWYMVKGDQRGSSTLSQQLAKNLFKTRNDEFQGILGYVPIVNVLLYKAKEWMLAIKLERNYTKEEIINMYLNTVDFGSNAFGIKVAARTFFNTSPDSLTIEQSATLVGALKATTLYNPVYRPENSLERRNVVLDLMVQNTVLNPKDYDSIRKIPLKVDFKVENSTDGIATYFRGVLNKYLLKWCKENGKDLYGDGLKIYTTLDSRMQKHAEDAVAEHMTVVQKKFFDHWKGQNPWRYENKKEITNFIEDASKKTLTYKMLVKKFGEGHDSINIVMNTPVKMTVFSWEGEKDTLMSPIDSLKYYKHFLHSGFMSMDPSSGEIKAWVGGINYKYFKYDHVKQGKRQAGSSFKPFVYAAAIEKGYTPCYLLPDAPITFRYEENGEMKTWSPKNADWVFTGDSMTLRQAIGRSINSVAAQVLKLIGIDAVINEAKKLGITSKLEPVPSICLGSSDVSVYEMVGAYSAFVNSGVWVEPYFISRIEDRNGNILHEVIPKTRDALSEDVAYVMVHMLKGGVEERGGTSQALFKYNIFRGNEVGGKTGTTSNHSDGWYMGITKNLVSGVWVGGEDRSIHFRTSQLGEGSKIALPIFGLYMEKVYADDSLNIPKGYFKRPKKLSININCPPRPEPALADSIVSDSLMEVEDPEEFY